MDKNKDRKILLYLSIAAGLGITYWLVNYLSNRKTQTSQYLSLEKTRKILQQIKYQVLAFCTTFVEGIKLKPKTSHSQQELQLFYRSELAKIYDIREDSILSKFVVNKGQYAASLQKYKKDEKIQQGQKQILQMLENAIKGILPDYTVPVQAKNVLTNQQIPLVYQEMWETICVKIWEKLQEQRHKNPGFNSKDEIHYKKALRQLSIYDIKVQFLEKKGFISRWGCPNETFYKVTEAVKKENKDVKHKTLRIEKAYENVIEKITIEPHHLSPERIKFLFNQIVNQVSQIQPVPQPQPLPIINTIQQKPIQNTGKRQAPPIKKDDDLNMDELMLQQLLSRSQQVEPEAIQLKQQ